MIHIYCILYTGMYEVYYEPVEVSYGIMDLAGVAATLEQLDPSAPIKVWEV